MFKKIEELEVYQLSEVLADEIWKICSAWNWFAKSTVGKQCVSAADSIGANICEGHGRFSLKENIQFYYYARGSLDETRNWLRRAYCRALMTENQFNELTELTEKLGKKTQRIHQLYKM